MVQSGLIDDIYKKDYELWHKLISTSLYYSDTELHPIPQACKYVLIFIIPEVHI